MHPITLKVCTGPKQCIVLGYFETSKVINTGFKFKYVIKIDVCINSSDFLTYFIFMLHY
jgi:hypothetical protein